MNKIHTNNYNFEKTLLGGQAFNWDKINESFYGFTQNEIIKLSPKLGYVEWESSLISTTEAEIKEYLGLNVDYESILKNINKDRHINNAINYAQSIRILNQDFEQTLLSFILTSNKNIKAVRKTVRDLSKEFGEEIIFDNKTFYTFPKTEVLNQISEAELKKFGLGFRAKYFKAALAKLQAEQKLAERLRKLDENEARNELIQFYGIGDKIADCVLSFSLKFQKSIPIDVWAKRVLTDLYNVDQKLSYNELRNWYTEYFGDYTIWAAQFLFEYIRENSKSFS